MPIDNKLKQLLEYIPKGILREIIGQNICDAIVNYNLFNNNLVINYSEIVINKFGNELFQNKDVLKKLVLFLPSSYIKSICSATKINYTDEEDGRKKIITKALTQLEFSEIFLQELGLDTSLYINKDTPEPRDFDDLIVPDFKLHRYQKDLKDKAIQYLLSIEHSNKLLIHMPTGAGKTKTAMELISDYIRSRTVLGGFDKSFFIVWLAHSKELSDQAYDTFKNTWKLRGDYELNAFKIYGDHDYDPKILESSSGILFVGFQKFNALINSNNLLQRKIKQKIVDQVKLVVIDEAHKSLATTYEQTINILTESYAGVQMVGLTATPGRNSDHSDMENNHLAYFFNSTKLGLIDENGVEIIEPIKYLQQIGVLAEIEREELISDVEINLAEQQIKDLKAFGDDKLNEILNNLSINPGRNHLIIEKVNTLHKNGDSILIFACNIEHCIILQTLLQSYGINSKTVLGTTKKEEREDTIKKFKSGELKIIINYGVLTTGFDAPNLNSLVITRPTSSLVLYSQMLGRALRGPLNGGNKINKLIDLKDNWNLGSANNMFDFYNEIWQ